MDETRKLLILRLEGILQSWGDTAKWDFRDSSDIPSKSGVIGLLSCALGLERGDPQIAQLSSQTHIAVRADLPGVRAQDFQTVTGAPLRNAQGKPRSLGNTIISRRVYLQDACFTVAVETTAEWHARLVSALNDPKWCLYLGRKNCVPSRPVLECAEPEYAGLEDAITRYPPARGAAYPMSVEWETEHPDCSSYTRPDERVEGERSFVLRRVWRGVIREAKE